MDEREFLEEYINLCNKYGLYIYGEYMLNVLICDIDTEEIIAYIDNDDYEDMVKNG